MDWKKSFFIGLTVISLVVITCGIITLSHIKANYELITTKSLEAIRDTTHAAINAWAQENEHHLKLLVTDPYLIKLAETLIATDHSQQALLLSPAQNKLRDHLKSTLKQHGMRGYFIITRDNISISSTRDANTGIVNLTINQPEFLQRLWAGETLISRPQASDVPLQNAFGEFIKHYPTMFVGGPLRNSKGEVIALFTLRLDPMQSLKRILDRGRIGDTGESYLINEQGYLLTDTRFKHELVQMNFMRDFKGSIFDIKITAPYSTNEKSSQLTAMAASAIKGGKDVNVTGYKDYRGKIVVGAWEWNQKYGFAIATEVDKDEAFASYNETKASFIIFSCGAMLLFAGFAWIFTRMHSRMLMNEEQADILFENAGDPILIIDNLSGKILLANQLASNFLGYDNEELLNLYISQLRSNTSQAVIAKDFADINQQGSKLIEEQYTKKNGQLLPVEVNAKLIPYQNNIAILSIIRDISLRKKTEKKLIEMANTDMLTMLGNRTAFDHDLAFFLRSQMNSNHLAMMLFIDIDEFRIINDTLGHIIGDQTLRIVAQRIKNAIPPTINAYRFGGDEFTLFSSINNENEVYHLCDKIHDAFENPIYINENELHITISTGISISTLKGLKSTDILKSADSALYAAKQEGRNRYKVFNEDMRDKDIQHLAIRGALSSALRNKEFQLYFQPVIQVKSNEIVGAEALIRWHSAELGVIGPDVFIPIAESSGKIQNIGQWVLDCACKIQSRWIKQGFDSLKVSINLSPVQLASGNIVTILERVLAKYSLHPSAIAFEITEGVLMEGHFEMLTQLTQLKKIGVALYLDDFGTGYSSLSYLNKYPFDVIKMDKRFITNMEFNEKDQSLAKTVIAMANNLGMQVIAEGVESQWQVDFLRIHGCHRIQGYFYGKPVPEDEFIHCWQK